MLIPSIDLMGGKIVQLIQGERKAVEFDNFDFWIERFSKYPLVQLIDLDAAIRSGENQNLIEYFVERLPCQVGGGIHTIKTAHATLALGAKKVIIGSALLCNGKINTSFASEIAAAIGHEQLVFAVDSRGGRVVTHGWKSATTITPLELMQATGTYCGAFLYTHIDTEGLMHGIPLDVVQKLRTVTSRKLIVAGGIRSHEEISILEKMDVDAVVGMAIYTDSLKSCGVP